MSQWKPIVEWAIWIVIAGIVYIQMGSFDKEIAEYAFGATGWPIALCIGVVLGASGQLANQLLSANADDVEHQDNDIPASSRLSHWRLIQRVAIFVLPLIYLFLVPYVGFYLATPVFVIALLLVLEVSAPLAIIGVTVVVYGLVLLLFTRFFFVALPTGRIAAFYDLNNAIIGLVRTGM